MFETETLKEECDKIRLEREMLELEHEVLKMEQQKLERELALREREQRQEKDRAVKTGNCEAVAVSESTNVTV
jgi:hypothetical protein